MDWNAPVFVTVVTGGVVYVALSIATAVVFGVMMSRVDDEAGIGDEW